MCYKFGVYFLLVSTISAKSFTVLLDTTSSMQEEIYVIKTHLGSVVHLLDNSTDVENFILVPFNDPDVGPTTYSQTPDGLVTSLNALRLSGGHDCPENSIAGIETALRVSGPESYVFVFTDAYAKDNSKFTAIESLCRSTHSQVIIFLNGRCVPSENSSSESDVGNIDVYYDIAKACAGTVFRLEESTISLRQAFEFMKEFIKVGWNDIVTHESFTNYKELPLAVDSFTKDFVIAVNGDIASPDLHIINNDGNSPTTETIMVTGYSRVIRLVNPAPGQYKAVIRCQGSTSATFYRKKELPFQFGFSTRLTKSLKETSLRPLPGRSSYILIVMRENTMKLNKIELEMVDGNIRKYLILDENDIDKGLYVANSFIEPDKSFRIVVSGQDTSTYQDFTVSTENMKPQLQSVTAQWVKPSVEILELESTTVNFGTKLTVACKVYGYPKPNIRWECDNGGTISSEDILLEIPYVHISYATIDNFESNTTIYCKAENSLGEDYRSVELFIYRPFSFEVIQSPEDTPVEYSGEGKIYCKVRAYPEAYVKWYHNDSLLETSENIQISVEENMLLIKNMTLDDAGEYKCEAANEVETKMLTAMVTVSGLEAPVLEVQNSEIVLKPGDWTNIDCSIIRGKPTPVITWKYKTSANEYDFTYLPDGVYAEGSQLKIDVVKTEHNGVYRCEAANLQGQDNRDVTVKVKYAPIISINQQKEWKETLTVREGDAVELKCNVDSEPAARVRWDMSQDDVIVAFDERHITDDHFTHRFDALSRDSGNYHCCAENDVGRAEKTITVNVLVMPFIETPAETMTVRAGAMATLPCKVLFGNPVPSTRWEFKAQDSASTVLLRDKSTGNLQLTRVKKEQEGTYSCLAENEVGYDIIRIRLFVQ